MPDKYQQIREDHEIEYAKEMTELRERLKKKIRRLYIAALIIFLLFTYFIFYIFE